MMTKHRDSLWHLAAIGCLACTLPACSRPVDANGDAGNEVHAEAALVDASRAVDGKGVAAAAKGSFAEATVPPEEGAVLKPVEMVFMYKGIGKFVTPEDQEKVIELFKEAETLGPDGALLILEDLDRRVSSGPGFDFDGIMWCNEDNEFATIDVHAKPGKVPEDWPGLIAEPFEFPPDATYLVGQCENLSWYGTIPMGVRVDTSGWPEQYLEAYIGIHQQIVNTTRDPAHIIRSRDADVSGTLNEIAVEPYQPNDPAITDYSWQSDDHQRWFRLIGSWPFGMAENPQGEWLFVNVWTTSQGRKMRVTHLWISQLPIADYVLPQSVGDLFDVYSMYPRLRRYGIYDVTGGADEKFFPEK